VRSHLARRVLNSIIVGAVVGFGVFLFMVGPYITGMAMSAEFIDNMLRNYPAVKNAYDHRLDHEILSHLLRGGISSVITVVVIGGALFLILTVASKRRAARKPQQNIQHDDQDKVRQ
jgi:hypothetical protein